ncbi:MAG: peptidase [Gammaproteobacteria bacterium SHHR-1]|uniref:PepSY domain-containing protein n=1 Tax=Magnetovirga frankeli TaxID=947516 RepID=UPI001293B3C5|nr:peptidase [gamma proteobacterium SS-5]
MKNLAMKALGLSALLGLVLGLSSQPWASEDKDADKAYALRQSHQVLPLQVLLQRVHIPVDARVLEVEYEQKRDRHLYEIEYLLPDGRVEELKVDALSAEILQREQKD